MLVLFLCVISSQVCLHTSPAWRSLLLPQLLRTSIPWLSSHAHAVRSYVQLVRCSLFACAHLLVGVCVRARICGTHMQPRTRSYVRSYVQLVRCSLFACAHLLVGVCVCASTHLWHAHAATHMQLNYILRAAGVCFLVCRLLLVCGCERTCTHICALTNLLMVSD